MYGQLVDPGVWRGGALGEMGPVECSSKGEPTLGSRWDQERSQRRPRGCRKTLMRQIFQHAHSETVGRLLEGNRDSRAEMRAPRLNGG